LQMKISELKSKHSFYNSGKDAKNVRKENNSLMDWMIENGLGEYQNEVSQAIKALFVAGDVPYSEETDMVQMF